MMEIVVTMILKYLKTLLHLSFMESLSLHKSTQTITELLLNDQEVANHQPHP